MVGFDGYKKIKGTKIHAAVAEGSLPIAVAIGSGREHKGRKLIPLMESISIKTEHKGRPSKRPDEVYADSKYDMPLVKIYLDGKHVKAKTPSRSKKRRGRPREFDKASYIGVRYKVDRFFGRLENFKRIAMRYERRAKVFLGVIYIACIMILWRILK